MRSRTVAVLVAVCAGLMSCSPATPRQPTGDAGTGSAQGAEPPAQGSQTGGPNDAEGAGGGAATITLAFAGDVHFERQVAALLQDPETVWQQRLPELRDADFSMVNLETAISERGRPAAKRYTFRAPATALDVLKAAGVDAVSMANNHAADYGRIGVQDTLAAKKSNVLPIVGFGANAAEAYAPLTLDVEGVKIAVLAASQVAEETARDWPAGPDSPGIAVALDRTKLREAVRSAAAGSDLVIAQMHWGTEGSRCPNENQVATVADLQADGADVVVGTHAHRPQGSGWQGRTFVGYGTGNFIWYNTSAESRVSGVLRVTVDANAARERGRAVGAQRTTSRSLITDYTWSPKYISTAGVPEDPPGGTKDRLRSLQRAATACANLDQTRRTRG